MAKIVDRIKAEGVVAVLKGLLSNTTGREYLLKKLDDAIYRQVVLKNSKGRPRKVQEDKYNMLMAMAVSVFRNIDRGIISRNIAYKTLDSLVKGALLHSGADAERKFKEKYGFSPPSFLTISPGKACNLRCKGCYAASGANPEKLSFDVFERIVREAHDFWGSRFIVISGGEPSLNRGLVPLLQELKRMDFKIKLLTNGSNEPLIRKIMLSKLVDVITLDVKAPLVDKNYRDTTKSNVDIRNIRNLITFLKGSSFQYEISVTPVPGLMKEEDFERILASLVGVKTLVIRQFNPINTIDPSFEKVEPYSREYLEMLCKKAERAVRKCMLR